MKNGSQAANQMFSAFPGKTFTVFHLPWLQAFVILAEKIFEPRRSRFSKVAKGAACTVN
jgi:hypothetical protein